MNTQTRIQESEIEEIINVPLDKKTMTLSQWLNKRKPKGKSLEGTDKEIKYRLLHHEYLRTGVGISTLVKINTGLTLHQYLNRRFNRVGYYQWKHQMHNYKHVKINFWDL